MDITSGFRAVKADIAKRFVCLLPVSVTFFELGIGYYIYTFITEHR